LDSPAAPTSGCKASGAIPQKSLPDLINDFGDRIMVAILEAISSKDNECRSLRKDNKIRSGELGGRMTMLLRHKASLTTSEPFLSSLHMTNSNDDLDQGEEDTFNKGDSSQTLVVAGFPELELSSEVLISYPSLELKCIED